MRIGYPCLNWGMKSRGESVSEALEAASRTWSAVAGPLLVDYSTQEPGKRRGTHADTLDDEDFRRFLEESAPRDFDLMLEIRDKEASALRALKIAATDQWGLSMNIRRL